VVGGVIGFLLAGRYALEALTSEAINGLAKRYGFLMGIRVAAVAVRQRIHATLIQARGAAATVRTGAPPRCLD